METNPYVYDRTVPWIPQQNQFYENNYVTAHTGQQRPPVLQNQKPQQRSVDQIQLANGPNTAGKTMPNPVGAGLPCPPPIYRPASSPIRQQHLDQKPKPSKPMPKARALALVRTFKKWLVVASLAAFVSFSGLVAYHHVGTAASQTSSSSQDSNGFLNQQGGNNFGSSNSSQGSTSGTSNSSQAPVSGSHTS